MKLELEVGLLFCDFVPCFLFFFISCALLLVISLLAGLYWADFTKRDRVRENCGICPDLEQMERGFLSVALLLPEPGQSQN